MGSIKTPSPSRMGWLTMCLVGVLLVNVKSMPLEEETEVNNQDEMRDIFTRLFVESREGRDLDMEIDNTIEDGEDGENKAIDGAIQETNTQEISRFNNYIDAIYKRMNAALRAKLMDPMVLNLQGKDKKEASEKNDSKKRVERDVEQKDEDADAADDTDEEEMEMEMEAETEIEHRVGEPKSKQKGNKNKDKKEKREKNKNKNMKEKKDKTKKKEKKNKEGKEEKKSANKQKRKEEKEKAKKDKEKAKKDKEEAKAAKKSAKAEKADKKAAKAAKKDNDQARESRSRDHGQHQNKRKGGKSLKKGGNGGKKDKKEKNGKKEKKKNNSNKKEKKPKGKGSKGKAREKKEDKEVEKESKVMGSLAGIATLRRSGDVTVMDEDNHKVVTSTFTVGPLQLEVSKTLGQGKSRTVKTAKATTDVMTGTMILKVKPDGSAHVKKVVFDKPDHVDVKGSLSDNKPRSITYLKNSVNRMRPIAAQKILKTARYVLKAPATVKQ